MAGLDPTGAFNADTFRAQIRSTMTMGLPNAANDQPTFYWTTQNTYGTADPAGSPYLWGATPIETIAKGPVQALCAIQFKERMIEGDAFGSFDPSSVTLTLLDEDYATIEGADQVSIGEVVYNIDVVAPPQGLFNVNVYMLYCTATDALGVST